MNLSDKDSLAFEDFVSFLKRHPEIKNRLRLFNSPAPQS